MELLESDDPTKGQLLEKSRRHRQQLEEDTRLISERTEKIITNAIIIGSALAVTYFVLSRFSGSKEKKKKHNKAARIELVHQPKNEAPVSSASHAAEPEPPGMMTQIGTALASQATMFLLQLAKEKLNEFMQAQAEKSSGDNEPVK